jgi:hypothetical protein
MRTETNGEPWTVCRPLSNSSHLRTAPSVELVSVKNKNQQQEAQQINFSPDDMLRATRDPKTAEEPFEVVGCEKCMEKSKKTYLGGIGCVVRVEQFEVQLWHACFTHLRWGNDALSKPGRNKGSCLQSILIFTLMHFN